MEHDDLGPPLPENEADALMTAYSLEVGRGFDVDPIRVRAIFDRIREQSLPAPRSDQADHGLRSYAKLYLDALEQALRHLPSERALRMFETADLRDLFGRRLVYAYLLDNVSFLTVSELAEVIEEFIVHLAANELPLVATGLPSTTLGCSWPGLALRNLYPTRAVTGYESEDLVGPAEPSSPRDRALSHLPATRRATRRLTYVFWDRSSWRICAFDEASLARGLDEAAARRVEAGRQDFLRLEIAVLRHLAASLRAGDPERLWTGSSDLLTAALLAEEAAFYLQIDRLLSGYDIIPQSTGRPMSPKFLPGGLSDLLIFIGHCAKELQIGTMDRTKRLMPQTVLENEACCYFQAVDQPWQAEVDGALQRFVQLRAHEAAFWTAYRERVNQAVEGEFYAEVVTRTKVKQKLVATFEPHVRGYAEAQRAWQEATGTLLPISLTFGPNELRQVRKNRFQRNGKGWVLEFEGCPIYLSDYKGLHYIAYLLRHPHREFNAIELVQHVEGTTASSRRQVDVASDDPWEESLSIRRGTGDNGPVLDDQAKDEYRRRLKEIEEDITDARTRGDSNAEERLETERDAIISELTAAVGLGGRDRVVGSDLGSARTAVTNAIRRVKSKIAAVHPSLAEHLRYIKTGSFLSYDPPRDDVPAWGF